LADPELLLKLMDLVSKIALRESDDVSQALDTDIDTNTDSDMAASQEDMAKAVVADNGDTNQPEHGLTLTRRKSISRGYWG
jgi:hypothetical protein